MVSGIGAVSSGGSSYAVSAIQSALTPQTKARLETLGVDTSNIQTEAQGQTTLQEAQSSGQNQSTQQSQGSQQGQQSGGDHAAFEAIKQQATSLAEKLGVSVSSTDKLSDILDSISKTITNMQTQAVNDPQKAAQVAQYQSEYEALGQSIQSLESSKAASGSQQTATQLQASLTGLANYNVASMSISSSNTGNTGTSTKH